MPIILLDTGVLLRLFDAKDSAHSAIRECFRRLRAEAGGPRIAMQNLTEFWNVTTRPAVARGGYGKPPQLAERRVRLLEKNCTVLFPSADSLREWKKIVQSLSVCGVQVHDAHLVAVMRASSVSHIVTLNKSDFGRFTDITAQTPEELISQWPV
jgi:predicted nucleic acid-binding protein